MFGWYLALKIVIAVLLSLLLEYLGWSGDGRRSERVQLLYRNAKRRKRSIKKPDYILTGSCKMVWIVNTLILVLAYKALAGPVQISVFPGAEGVGKYTLSGRRRLLCHEPERCRAWIVALRHWEHQRPSDSRLRGRWHHHAKKSIGY